MDAKMKNYLNYVSKNRISIVRDNFLICIKDYQVLAVANEDKYEITILKNYIPKEIGTVEKKDIPYFIMLVDNKVNS